MSGFLTYPLVCFYLRIKGGLDGITLFMRYACSFFQILTAVFIYIRLNKISWGGALVASISYLLYIPFGIMALSYNSLGIMMLLIFSVIISTAEKTESSIFNCRGVLCCCSALLSASVVRFLGILDFCSGCVDWQKK